MGKYDALFDNDTVVEQPKSKYSALFDEEQDSQQPAQQGYLSGINKAMDDKASEYAQKSMQPEKYPLQHTIQKANMIFDIPMSGLGKAIEPVMPILKPIAKGIIEGAAFSSGMRGSRDASVSDAKEGLGKSIQKYDELKNKYPALEATGDLATLGSNIAGLGVGGIAPKVGKEFTVDAMKATGEGLKSSGLGFKLGDMKIKDAIAKKGYGKDLIEKKQNIANTIYDYGLTKGGNKGGAQKAEHLTQEIFNKTDNIIKDLSNQPNAITKNPVKAMTENLDLDKLVDIDEEDIAKNFVESITKKFAEKGFDQDLTLDKLVEAKKMLDRKGTLFKSGVPVSSDDAIKTAIKKKMYLNLVGQIAEVSPELKALNTEAKKLMDAGAALSAASSRVANKDAISLTDWILGAGTLANPYAIPLLVAKKGLANGRGSDLMLNTARVLKGDKVKTIDDILIKNKQ